ANGALLGRHGTAFLYMATAAEAKSTSVDLQPKGKNRFVAGCHPLPVAITLEKGERSGGSVGIGPATPIGRNFPIGQVSHFYQSGQPYDIGGESMIDRWPRGIG